MLLQILAAWPLPAAPACRMFLPMDLRSGSARAKPVSPPPTMKVSVPASAPAVPPETGRVHHLLPRLGRGGADGARTLDIDGRAIDQQRALGGAGDHPARLHVDRADMLARRQHGDDGLDTLGGVAGTGDRGGADGLERIDIGGGDIEDLEAVPGLDQVARHRPAHVAQTDEADRRHALFLPIRIVCALTKSNTKAQRTQRGIAFVSFVSLWLDRKLSLTRALLRVLRDAGLRSLLRTRRFWHDKKTSS